MARSIPLLSRQCGKMFCQKKPTQQVLGHGNEHYGYRCDEHVNELVQYVTELEQWEKGEIMGIRQAQTHLAKERGDE